MLKFVPPPVRHPVSVFARTARLELEYSRLVAGPPRLEMRVPRVIAVHFPKAAGTSLMRQFADALGSGLALDYRADPLAGAWRPRAFPSGKSMVIGHFHPNRYDTVEAFRLTFLRHPVANVISTYFFLKTVPDRGHPMHRRFLRDRPSLIDFARQEGMRRLMTETYFGGFDMGRMDFIGFHESRAEDLARLSGLLGIPLSSDVHANPTQFGAGYREAQQDRALQAQLTEILADDIAFYERMRARAGY